MKELFSCRIGIEEEKDFKEDATTIILEEKEEAMDLSTMEKIYETFVVHSNNNSDNLNISQLSILDLKIFRNKQQTWEEILSAILTNERILGIFLEGATE